MKRDVKRLLNYIQKHLSGTGIAAVMTVMAITVILGAAGETFGFDPENIDQSYAAKHSESPDGTGYDLSEDGEESEDINQDSDREQENEGTPEPEEKDTFTEHGNDPIILPEGMTGNTDSSGTVGGTADPDADVSWSNPGENIPGTGAGNPSGTEQPGGGGSSEGENPSGEKFVIYVNGKAVVFDSEDEALVWVADNAGKNENGQYFEGTFITDKNGNLIPGYADKDKFEEGVNGDISYDYTGDSEIFVVPGGTKRLELGRGQPAETRKEIKTIVIPQTVTDIASTDFGANGFVSLEKFIVSENNPNFFAVDGVLYRRKETGEAELCLMPAAKKTVQEWPAHLTIIGKNSFADSRLDRAELPDTVVDIKDYAFIDSYIGTIVIPENVRSIGSVAFGHLEIPMLNKEIIVKESVPPAVTGSTFLYMSSDSPVTAEILVPDSENDKIYEAYLAVWGKELVNRYGKDAALQILRTAGGAQTRYEYVEEGGGKKGFRRVGETKLACWWDTLGAYRTDEAGNIVMVKCTVSSEVINLADSGIVSIDEGAFADCTLMTAVRLPDSLKKMPENCFENNKNLKVIISYAAAPPALNPGVSKSCSVFVKPGVFSAYQSVWGGQVRKILGISETYSVTKSGLVLDSAGSSRLLDIPADMKSLTLPSYVTSIYDRAMADNEVLSSIVLPSRIVNVGEGTFAGCTGLTSVSWQTSVDIPASGFEGCVNLKSFTVSGSGRSLKNIGNRAFYGCTNLRTFMIPSAVTAVRNQVFDGRGGSALTLTFEGTIPPIWTGPESVTGLTIYVPDSDGDTVYGNYLDSWKGWLGAVPGNVLKTAGGAESRVMSAKQASEPAKILKETLKKTEPEEKTEEKETEEKETTEKETAEEKTAENKMTKKETAEEKTAEKEESIDHDY